MSGGLRSLWVNPACAVPIELRLTALLLWCIGTPRSLLDAQRGSWFATGNSGWTHNENEFSFSDVKGWLTRVGCVGKDGISLHVIFDTWKHLAFTRLARDTSPEHVEGMFFMCLTNLDALGLIRDTARSVVDEFGFYALAADDIPLRWLVTTEGAWEETSIEGWDIDVIHPWVSGTLFALANRSSSPRFLRTGEVFDRPSLIAWDLWGEEGGTLEPGENEMTFLFNNDVTSASDLTEEEE